MYEPIVDGVHERIFILLWHWGGCFFEIACPQPFMTSREIHFSNDIR
jgi:hypothetical protein